MNALTQGASAFNTLQNPHSDRFPCNMNALTQGASAFNTLQNPHSDRFPCNMNALTQGASAFNTLQNPHSDRFPCNIFPRARTSQDPKAYRILIRIDSLVTSLAGAAAYGNSVAYRILIRIDSLVTLVYRACSSIPLQLTESSYGSIPL